MKRPCHIGAAICLGTAALLWGCATTQVSGVSPSPSFKKTPAEIDRTACPFSIEKIDDQRKEDDLGGLLWTHVDGTGFMHWFTDGMESIPGYTREHTERHIHITVLKAYIRGIHAMKSANIVVRVDDSLPTGKPGRSKVYRGLDNTTNWSSTEYEIQKAFDRALMDLSTQIAADLRSGCRS